MIKGHSKRSTEISLKFSQNNFVSGLKIKKQLIKIAPCSQRLNRGARPKYPALEVEQLKTDRAKFLKELKEMEDDRSTLLNNSEKDVDSVTETNDLNDQAEFKNLLAKYYIETDFYEHAVKTLDV
ncbi:hypothetical protein RhiirA5_406311 [Rhizophagus irregularis]|uniref:Uncharacterized protein n=2 Tax=Rhizophagus irregularis TaxID=588596 RepID=A0A2N0S6G9_9GLOM|nr:hypothetical protein GLOIN_2v1776852 [Rhizophagus irregularis DAOM 181602=DAOM 197198]PKC17039.1 hypothetical protein RhiirA5_406311 [Rhizophagus irregularis]PKC71149.1 hypothetical protein RhiirA1_453883 [Rhizophagus irregularis]POG69527.1 hypothetical protein GLOIN_2v1776852 [Rhizophagus irregularis DAOM 181602=DAOM 197198]CAG8696354.1 6145_t:CDS:2 [Rhizophagus irregularis]|eukprot:XP_025176393.1 hypothetical protein GLOIN_2v1776852 [Rhizophagus irregularis DAOM 181602=DAOM 197198]